MAWLTGNWAQLGTVAGKAVLMYGIALLALRMGERRTLAQWTIIDFVAAIAVGAIVGRTAIAGTQSFVTGAVALVTLVVMHRVVSLLRFSPRLRQLMDHRARLLVAHGQLLRRQLRICGLTDDDLFAQLRQQGVMDLSGIRYVIYETKGGLSVVPENTQPGQLPALVQAALHDVRGRGDLEGDPADSRSAHY